MSFEVGSQELAILRHLLDGRCTVQRISDVTTFDPHTISAALHRLNRKGLARCHSGVWDCSTMSGKRIVTEGRGT